MNLYSLNIFLLTGSWNFYLSQFPSPRYPFLLEILIFQIIYVPENLNSLLFLQICMMRVKISRSYKNTMKTW